MRRFDIAVKVWLSRGLMGPGGGDLSDRLVALQRAGRDHE
jgi:hypothetical protein